MGAVPHRLHGPLAGGSNGQDVASLRLGVEAMPKTTKLDVVVEFGSHDKVLERTKRSWK